MDVPNVTRTEYQLVNVDDGFLNLMTTDGVPKDDVRVPDGDIGKQIQDDFEAGKDLLVTVTAAMGEEQAIAVKEAPTKILSGTVVCFLALHMDVPNVTRTEYQLVNVDDGFLNLMTTDGVPKDDVRVPDGDIGKQIQDDFEAGKDLLVTVTAAMGEEQAIAVKEAPTKS